MVGNNHAGLFGAALCLVQDVMTYLLEVEKRHLRTRNYLTAHPSVSQRTRAILVDWLIQVQVAYSPD